MKKIVLFTDSLGAGGAQRQLCGLAVMLRQHNYDVVVLTYHPLDFYKSYLDENAISNVVLGNGPGAFRRIQAIRKFLKSENPEWVIAYQETPSLIASILKVTGLKFNLIVSERNTTQKLTIKDKLRFSLYRYATSIVPNSYSQEVFLSTHYKWMVDKLRTITNFVDLDNFSYNVHRRNEVPLIVVAATIWPPKNTLGFIDALKILSDRGLAYKVNWYGYSEANDDYYQQAKLKIQTYGLSQNIELLPKTKNIKVAYIAADYFCLPSFYEGVPNAIAEAMSTGRPILCSNVCDNPRYVNDSNGFLFDPVNPKDIADKIEKALSVSEIEYAEMCCKSRELAENFFSKTNFIGQYIEILSNNGK